MSAKELKTPEEWSRITDVTILDPDGWRYDGKSWDEPITRKEWSWRWAISTQRKGYIPKPKREATP
jgi:hypothetical protein